MNNNCIYLKQKFNRTLECKKKKKIINIKECNNCKSKEYKKCTKFSKNSAKYTSKNNELHKKSTNNNQSNINTMLQSNTENIPIMNSEGNLINPNKYQYVKSENQNIDSLRKSASQYFNNSNETRNFVNTIEKVVLDKDYNVVFDNSIVNKDGKPVNAQITTENGKVIVKINPNSPRAGEFLLVHEITHAIETNSMKKLVLDYASKNSEFNTALENLKQTYGTNDVSSEVLADISGQLLGNQEFINSLSMQNTVETRSIIRKIYESIRRLLNTLTENGRYRNFVQDLETKWRDAYRTITTEQAVDNLNNEVKYAQKTLKDGTNYIEIEKGLFTKEDGTPMSQREIYDSLIGKVITFNDGTKVEIVNRLPNKNMYNEFFKRYPAYQNVNNIKTLNQNINENMVELLENSKNISPNEPDYQSRHAKQGITNFDTRLVSFYDGNFAYDLTLSIARLQNGKNIAYAKRNLSKNNSLTNKIKKEKPMSKSQLTSLSTNNIPQSTQNVNSSTSTRYSMQEEQITTQNVEQKINQIEQKMKENAKKLRKIRGK